MNRQTVCVCVSTNLSLWLMRIHQRHRSAPSDQHRLRVSQPRDSQLLPLDQRHHTCSTTPQTLVAHAHTHRGTNRLSGLVEAQRAKYAGVLSTSRLALPLNISSVCLKAALKAVATSL